MLNLLKRFMGDSSFHIAEEIFSLVMDIQDDEDGMYSRLMDRFDNYHKGVDFLLYPLYLFSYYVTTRRNAYHISHQFLDDIYQELKGLLADDLRKKYGMDKEKIMSILDKKLENHVEAYEKYDNISSSVERFIHEELAVGSSVIIEDENIEAAEMPEEKIASDLNSAAVPVYIMELIYNTITIMQDYLIDISGA